MLHLPCCALICREQGGLESILRHLDARIDPNTAVTATACLTGALLANSVVFYAYCLLLRVWLPPSLARAPFLHWESCLDLPYSMTSGWLAEVCLRHDINQNLARELWALPLLVTNLESVSPNIFNHCSLKIMLTASAVLAGTVFQACYLDQATAVIYKVISQSCWRSHNHALTWAVSMASTTLLVGLMKKLQNVMAQSHK